MRNGLTVFILLFFLSCKKDGNDPVIPAEPLYYPPVNSNTWETVTPASLGWNETALSNVYDYLQQKNTKAFIILYNGKLVVEKYFGTFTADSPHTTLRFTSLTPGPYGITLDGISILSVPPPPPIPPPRTQ